VNNKPTKTKKLNANRELKDFAPDLVSVSTRNEKTGIIEAINVLVCQKLNNGGVAKHIEISQISE
jgi:hypothetical protein